MSMFAYSLRIKYPWKLFSEIPLQRVKYINLEWRVALLLEN